MKRSHHKSRNGCDLCKKRRVKCDEREPTCTTCASRRTVCHYSRPKVDGRTRSAEAATGGANSTSKLVPRPGSSTSTASTSISPDPPTTSSAAVSEVDYMSSRRRKELQLMQFWFTKTCYSFTLPLGNLFNGYVVNMSLEYEFLADSMFALTSLHLASESTDPAVVAHYVSQSLHYQNNSMAEFRTAMQNPTITNCDAIFISSILTMACAVVSPQLPTGNHESASSMESVMALYEFINGISSIVNMNRQWLQDGPCKVMFWQFRDFEDKSAHDVEIPMELLRALNHSVNSSNNTLHAVYEKATYQLERCFTVDKRLAISWLASTGTEFASELQHRRPMALVIIMYWGIVLDELDDLWWAKYAGEKLVEELSFGLLGFYGEEWDKATNWAKAAVGS